MSRDKEAELLAPEEKGLKENMSLQVSKRLLSLEQDRHRIKFRKSFLRRKIMKN